MIKEKDAAMLKAYMTAHFMGVVSTKTEGGCDTCGWGGREYYTIELEDLHKMVDDFVKSPDNEFIKDDE